MDFLVKSAMKMVSRNFRRSKYKTNPKKEYEKMKSSRYNRMVTRTIYVYPKTLVVDDIGRTVNCSLLNVELQPSCLYIGALPTNDNAVGMRYNSEILKSISECTSFYEQINVLIERSGENKVVERANYMCLVHNYLTKEDGFDIEELPKFTAGDDWIEVKYSLNASSMGRVNEGKTCIYALPPIITFGLACDSTKSCSLTIDLIQTKRITIVAKYRLLVQLKLKNLEL